MFPNKTAPVYQAELDRCGYSHKLKFNPSSQVAAKASRNKTWFNPPYSMDVETNVGREFLKLVDLHFPPGHILHSTLNRSTVKVSYRCLPNMGAQVARHNAKLLNNHTNSVTSAPPVCNCQPSKRVNCPLPGACNRDGVVYQATVTKK